MCMTAWRAGEKGDQPAIPRQVAPTTFTAVKEAGFVTRHVTLTWGLTLSGLKHSGGSGLTPVKAVASLQTVQPSFFLKLLLRAWGVSSGRLDHGKALLMKGIRRALRWSLGRATTRPQQGTSLERVHRITKACAYRRTLMHDRHGHLAAGLVISWS